MNQAFLSGYLDGLEVNGVEAVRAPRSGSAAYGWGRTTPPPTAPHPKPPAPTPPAPNTDDTDDTAQGDPGADDR
ncbi:hypothetical protein ACFV2Z_30475 [Streptomyces sp. NPDC059688]|uniref:hypothetical protein n=1 Tax=Streptomyces sp. NPDC059688 TaxID=3346906 RepID=UPI0036CB8AE4